MIVLTIWLGCDWHLWNSENSTEHPYITKQEITKRINKFAEAIKDDDIFIFLGDLCDVSASDINMLKTLIHNIPGYKIMCRGNHDDMVNDFYTELGFDLICEVCKFHNIIFSHKPVKLLPDEINIHGHLHSLKLSMLGYQHINAYVSSKVPVRLEDLIKDATIEDWDDKKDAWTDTAIRALDKFVTFDNFDYRDIFNLESIYEHPVDENIVNEILFPDVESTKYWLSDDNEYDDELIKTELSESLDKDSNDISVVIHEASTTHTTPLKSTIDPNHTTKTVKSLYSYTKKICNTSRDFNVWYKKFPKELRHVRNNKNTITTLWLDKNENLIAYINLEHKDDKTIVIQAFEVIGKYRGYGLSKQILKYAIGNGANTLYVDPDNKVAIKLYQSTGWKFSSNNSGRLQSMVLSENAMRPNPPYFNLDTYIVTPEKIKGDDDSGLPSVYFEKLTWAVNYAVKHNDNNLGTYYIYKPVPGYLDMRSSSEHSGAWWSPDKIKLDYFASIEVVAPNIFEYDDVLDESAVSNFGKINVINDDGKPGKKFTYGDNTAELNEATIKFVNDKGVTVPKVCPKCGSKVGVFLRGEPVFLCTNKKCGKYFGTVPCNIDESAIDKKQVKFNNEKELYNWMKSNIHYHDYTKLKSRDEVISDGNGSCHDQVAFEYPILSSLKLKPKILFFIAHNPDSDKYGMTHSFCYWFGEDGVYWFENAWQDASGIRKYKDIKQLKTDIINRYKKIPDYKRFPELIFKNTSYNKYKPGLDLNSFVVSVMDIMTESASFAQVKDIIDNIPKKEHHLFYHGNTFKNSPNIKYRNARYYQKHNKKYGAFIDVYSFNDSTLGFIIIAAEPEARGHGLTDKLVQDAIRDTPPTIHTLYWKCDKTNVASYKLAERNDFIFDSEEEDEYVLRYDRKSIKNNKSSKSTLTESIHDYKFELLDSVYFNDRVNEAVNDDDKLYPVYILIMHSGSILANAIKTVTHSHFSHSSISFDASLKTMYSFGRKADSNPLIGGFTKENISNPFFQRKPIPYALYVVFYKKSDIDKMKKRLEYFIKNKSKFKYDFIGLFKNYFGVADNPEYRWFCSRFVADIINAGSPTNSPSFKEPSLVRPEDFQFTSFARYISGGYLNEYDAKHTIKQTKKLERIEILKNNAESSVIAESYDLNVYNPYIQNVLEYQLINMSESAFDDFMIYIKSFKLRFDKDGNIIITRREYNQIDKHFNNSLKQIKAFEKAENYEGVKEELCKIYYLISIINKYYMGSDTMRKSMMDLRSVMLNVFQQKIRFITKHEPDFNFQKYFDKSKYGKNITIPKKVISAIGSTIITNIL